MKELSRQYGVARKNLGEAALSSPLYGILVCIRSVIDLTDVENLFKISLQISSIIAPVLGTIYKPRGQ